MAETEKHAWFKPRRYGFGATPVTWQGWLLVAADIAIVFAATWMVLPTDAPPPTINLLLWLALVIGATAVAVWIAWRTTDGAWAWRWRGRRRGTN